MTPPLPSIHGSMPAPLEKFGTDVNDTYVEIEEIGQYLEPYYDISRSTILSENNIVSRVKYLEGKVTFIKTQWEAHYLRLFKAHADMVNAQELAKLAQKITEAERAELASSQLEAKTSAEQYEEAKKEWEKLDAESRLTTEKLRFESKSSITVWKQLREVQTTLEENHRDFMKKIDEVRTHYRVQLDMKQGEIDRLNDDLRRMRSEKKQEAIEQLNDTITRLYLENRALKDEIRDLHEVARVCPGRVEKASRGSSRPPWR